MDNQGLVDFLKTACEKYYAFLQGSTRAGKNEYKITKISRIEDTDEFHCDIDGNPYTAAEYYVTVDGKRIDQIEVLKLSKSPPSVRLRVLKNVSGFASLSPDRVSLVSDLAYLVKRLWKYYSDQSESFEFLPKLSAFLPNHSYTLPFVLSPEQQEAVEGIFSNPVSYVWGPPGTGKTRCVLAFSILRYLAAEKRILLLGPTNNAVEQMLRGVLPILQSVNIDLHTVYRFGTSSGDFARQYPEVVSSSELDAEAEALQQQKEELVRKLSQFERLHELMEEKESLVSSFSKAEVFMRAYYGHDQKIKHLSNEISILEKQIENNSETIENDKYHIAQLLLRRSDLKEEIAHVKKKLNWSRLALWNPTIKATHEIHLSQLFYKLESVGSELVDCSSHVDRLSADVKSVQSQIDSKNTDLSATRESLLSCLHDLKALPFPDGTLHQLLISLDDMEIGTALYRLHEFRDQLSARYDSIPTDVSQRDAIQKELDAVNLELFALGKNDKQQQKENALVYAGTIDAMVRHLPVQQGKKISHVFLDEAGYTSLARGLVAFSCACPVTFLGDHKQLPPICEMEPISEPNMEVAAFSLPCAFYSEALAFSVKNLYRRCYADKSYEPDFGFLPVFSLHRSYRFSSNLAKYLNKYIYRSYKFSGKGDSFEISILDASNPEWHRYARYSKPEVKAIKDYLNDFQPDPDEIAILAPYSNQISLLRSEIPEYRGSIMTVHRSQGMEFDTVVLSVVDKADRYFVDSNEPIGRAVLNTAISRTKRHLIIVCDTTYWQAQQDQLISDLLTEDSITLQNGG